MTRFINFLSGIPGALLELADGDLPLLVFWALFGGVGLFLCFKFPRLRRKKKNPRAPGAGMRGGW